MMPLSYSLIPLPFSHLSLSLLRLFLFPLLTDADTAPLSACSQAALHLLQTAPYDVKSELSWASEEEVRQLEAA